MLGKERQQEIISYLKLYGTVSVKKLTQMLFASEATVRRDLNELERNGIVTRVFGGATLVSNTNAQIPLFIRENEDAVEKMEICRRAAETLYDGAVIFLDASSTAQHMIQYIMAFKNITVITNGLKTATLLHENQIRTLCTGGELINNSYAFAGRSAEKLIDDFRFDICFISCKGMNDSGLFTDTSEPETYLRKTVMSCSKTKVMLIANSKFGKTYMHKLCRADDLDYIYTNGILPNAINELPPNTVNKFKF